MSGSSSTPGPSTGRKGETSGRSNTSVSSATIDQTAPDECDCSCSKSKLRRADKSRSEDKLAYECYNRMFVKFTFDVTDSIFKMVMDYRKKQLSPSSVQLKNMVKKLHNTETMATYLEFEREFYKRIDTEEDDNIENLAGIVEDVLLQLSNINPESTHRCLLVALSIFAYDPQLFRAILAMRADKKPKPAVTSEPVEEAEAEADENVEEAEAEADENVEEAEAEADENVEEADQAIDQYEVGLRPPIVNRDDFPFIHMDPNKPMKLFMLLVRKLAEPFIVTMTCAVNNGVTPFVHRKPVVSKETLCLVGERTAPPVIASYGILYHNVRPTFHESVLKLIENSTLVDKCLVQFNMYKGTAQRK